MFLIVTKLISITCDKCDKELSNSEFGYFTLSYKLSDTSKLSMHFCDFNHMMNYLENKKAKIGDNDGWSELHDFK